MNKNEENKLVDAIISLSQEIKSLRVEMKGFRKNMEKYQAKTNLAIGELRHSFMKLDESFNSYAQRNDSSVDKHEKRIAHLEEKNFGSSYVSEPKVKFRKTKRKK